MPIQGLPVCSRVRVGGSAFKGVSFRAGQTVFVVRDAGRQAEFVESCSALANVWGAAADAGDWEQTRGAVADAVEPMVELDVVVANAGFSSPATWLRKAS